MVTYSRLVTIIKRTFAQSPLARVRWQNRSLCCYRAKTLICNNLWGTLQKRYMDTSCTLVYDSDDIAADRHFRDTYLRVDPFNVNVMILRPTTRCNTAQVNSDKLLPRWLECKLART